MAANESIFFMTGTGLDKRHARHFIKLSRPSCGRGPPFMSATADFTSLRTQAEQLFAAGAAADKAAARALWAEVQTALTAGSVRAAEPDPASPTGWRVNPWVKQAILLGFRHGDLADVSDAFPFYDKDTMPVLRPGLAAGVRIVPGGSAIRAGAHLARGVVCMPPMYVNVGAHVGEGTMIDSHALVGSCAQIGKRVHLSAAAQVGGVIEPVGALPVIIEDDVMVGGNTGLYEGAIVKARAVIGAGVILTGSTPIYDLVNQTIIAPAPGQPVVVPAGAVVVPGARTVKKSPGHEWGLSVATPVIVKYRDDKTDARTELETWIR
jgi:2,3,4,5-tetrahydropyridine-2,6-dicarboxylate N-succinyltransferase